MLSSKITAVQHMNVSHNAQTQNGGYKTRVRTEVDSAKQKRKCNTTEKNNNLVSSQNKTKP